MYGIFTYIEVMLYLNVGRYTAHGASGFLMFDDTTFSCWSIKWWAHRMENHNIAGSLCTPALSICPSLGWSWLVLGESAGLGDQSESWITHENCLLNVYQAAGHKPEAWGHNQLVMITSWFCSSDPVINPSHKPQLTPAGELLTTRVGFLGSVGSPGTRPRSPKPVSSSKTTSSNAPGSCPGTSEPQWSQGQGCHNREISSDGFIAIPMSWILWFSRKCRECLTFVKTGTSLDLWWASSPLWIVDAMDIKKEGSTKQK